jgi:hypothetical protein
MWSEWGLGALLPPVPFGHLPPLSLRVRSIDFDTQCAEANSVLFFVRYTCTNSTLDLSEFDFHNENSVRMKSSREPYYCKFRVHVNV